MKKIAPAVSLFSINGTVMQNTILTGKATRSLLVNRSFLFSVIAGLLIICSHPVAGQTQIIGSFPQMEGGFEAASAATTAATTVAANLQLTSWTGSTGCTPAIYNSTVRTGTKSLQVLATSSAKLLWSNSAASTALANSTSYVVQFYWWKAHSSNIRTFDISVGPAGTTTLSTVTTPNLGVSAPSFEWTKQTVVITTGTSAASPRYGLVEFKNNGGSIPSPGYLFDDFCVYPGAVVDNIAPGDVTSPAITSFSSTSLTPSWTAPASGVDGGGYVVIRYAANPTSEPSPNANGIYAVGNSIGTGTIAYIGTALSFTDAGLSSNTAYYYKVFAVDKAFNYSPNPTVFAGFTGIAGQTAVTFTTPASCLTDRFTISWTGPLNYAGGSFTQIAFLKAGSAITAGLPAASPAVYTANTVFASGTAYENDASAFCIYKGDGTDAGGDHSGLTITGLSPNTTYYLLMYNVLDAGPSYSAGTTGNTTTLNNLAEPANNPGSFARGVLTTSNIPVSWAAAGGSPAPTGYLVQASNTAAPADPVDFTDPANQTNITGGTANFKTAGLGYSAFTGFSAGTMYYFRINSYTNSGTCINFKAGGPTINAATLPNAVTGPAISITGGIGNINWATASGYSNSNHTTLVFVSSTGPGITVGTPTANPSIYSANTTFGSGTPYQVDGNARCVYKGDGTNVSVSGLVSGTTYYVLVLTVVDAANYDVTNSYSAYATTSATYNAANEYTWIGGSSASWAMGSSWNPTRSSPAPTDVLIFNTAGNVTATSVPPQTIAKLSINAGNVTLQSSAPLKTLSITDNDGISFNDLIIANGASLTFGLFVSATLTGNTTANIIGTLKVNSGSTYNTDNAGAVTSIAGTLNNFGAVTSTVASRFVVTSGGVYNHAINGGTIPTGTWNTNSTCLVTGSTSTQNFSGHKQTFSNFVWDCPSQSHFFVLGENSSSTPPNFVISDSFIVKRTNGQILQLTSSGGQQDIVCGNYFQYGGLVTVTYNTDASGEQRSLTVNKTFYVTDSLESNAKFQIINNPGGENIVGRLFVGGNVEMHPSISSSTIERVIGGSNALAEIWFNGSTAQSARFSTISGDIDFVTNQTGPGVTLLSDATANFFKLVRGTFFIAANTLTIKNIVSYPAPGTGAIGGSSTSNLTMSLAGASGTLNFANGSRTLKNFTQLAGNAVSLGTELGITAGISPGRDSIGSGATLTTNDNLVLRSDANGTARMAQLPPTAAIVGKVTVERHLPMNYSSDSRRWRLLTAPFKASTAPTINAAWQEGVSNPDRLNPSAYDPKPGYGTHITKSTSFASDGYDQGSTNNPSIFYYSAGNWLAPANTNSVKITDNSGCYMLFARGDRSIVVSSVYINASPTTLEPKGELNIGNVTVPLTASGYQTVGNPYASSVLLDNVVFNDTLGKSKTIYLWDPKTLGSFNVGKFITCSGDGGTPASYTYTGNTSAYNTRPGIVESSGAFMVKGNGGSVVFHESDKAITSSSIGVASRPGPGGQSQQTGSFGTIRKLYTDLLVERDSTFVLADGIANTYNSHYSNSIDYFDAPKLTSFTSREELGIKNAGGLFAIERRKKLQATDTIHLNISKLNPANYLLNFRPEGFDDTYTAFLVDEFLHSSTPFRLTQHSGISFSITADAASSAPDRFFIIFRKMKNARPVTLEALIRNRDVTLGWEVPDDISNKTWFIERSLNGTDFSAISRTENSIEWLDRHPVPGTYFYRIRYMESDETSLFSNVAKVIIPGSAPAVYPNPVTNGQLGLQLGHLPTGMYRLKLLGTAGEILFTGTISWSQGNETKIIDISRSGARGMCRLEIMSGKKTAAVLNVLIQQ